jgi:hypothetical protein
VNLLIAMFFSACGLASARGVIALSKGRSRVARQESEQRAHEILMDRLELERLTGPREPATANLNISRPKRLVDGQSAYRVMVDGKNIGEIKNGETDSFSLPSGLHAVHLEMSRFQSPSVEVILEPGQTTSLMCQPHFAAWQAYPWALLHPGEWIALARDDEGEAHLHDCAHGGDDQPEDERPDAGFFPLQRTD